MVPKIRERLLVCKKVVQKFDMGRVNLKRLNKVAVKEHYQVKISNRFAVLENLDINVASTELGKVLQEIQNL
jgi:hypothetical protein